MSGIIGIVGGSQSFSSASGGKIYAYNNVSGNPIFVAPGNPSRARITFHNPSAADILVGPGSIFNGGSQTGLVPSVALPGGCFLIFANGGTLVLQGGEIQVAWQAVCAVGTIASLTVMDSNIP